MPMMPGVDDPIVPTADPGKEQAPAERTQTSSPGCSITSVACARRRETSPPKREPEPGRPVGSSPTPPRWRRHPMEEFEPEETAEIEPEHSLSVSDEESSESRAPRIHSGTWGG